MARTVLLIAVAALALAPSASAQFERALADGGESLTLDDGRGYAIVTSSSGTILGTVGRGRVVVTNYRRGARTKISFSGCDTRKRLGRRTVVCAGRGLSFSVVDGRWRVHIRGARINAGAVVEGSVTLEGTSGTYEIGDSDDEQPWPESARTFRLG
jgi:hypothetical protein